MLAGDLELLSGSDLGTYAVRFLYLADCSAISAGDLRQGISAPHCVGDVI